MTTIVRGIDHLGITVTDIEAATAYFVEAFGAVPLYDLLGPAVVDEGTGTVGLALEGPRIEAVLDLPAGTSLHAVRMLKLGEHATIELQQFSGSAQGEVQGSNDLGIQHFAVYVDDIEAAAQQVRDAGGRVLGGGPTPGGEAGPGNQALVTKTPWGSTIELVSYPSPKPVEAGATVRRWHPPAGGAR